MRVSVVGTWAGEERTREVHCTVPTNRELILQPGRGTGTWEKQKPSLGKPGAWVINGMRRI